MDSTIQVPLPYSYLRQTSTIVPLLMMMLVLPTSVKSALNNRQEICPPSVGNFTSGDPFATSLNLLFSSLSANTPATGFFNTSKGDKTDQVYGLALCRGDLKLPFDCNPCVENAVRDLRQVCAGKRNATIWYDDCLVRYSDENFFGFPEGHLQTLVSGETDPDAIGFKETVRSLVESVARRAAGSSGLYAIEEAKRSNSSKLYAMAQCTRDLTGGDCSTCLKDEMRYIISDAWTGVRTLGGSCFLRYESAPFYRVGEESASAAAPAATGLPDGNGSPTTTNSQGSRRKISSRTVIIISIVAVVIVTILALGIFIYMRNRKRQTRRIPNFVRGDYDDLQNEESLSLDLALLKKATNNFSEANLLGQGGFGPVYKGVIGNVNEVAVKRLARGSDQGLMELRNEVILVAKLQHRNLVRLLGWCLEEDEMLLVYEFVSHGSLDKLLYDVEKRPELDWRTRMKIVEGVARGLLYLHEDSRLTVVHRDLKASNILLDGNMNPKISDFGLAKLFGGDQTQQDTSRVAGTYGYMAPEYVMQGQFSTKSDVYSFGVIVLELVTGHSNFEFHVSGAVDLPNHVLQQWRRGNIIEILDPTLADKCSIPQVSRCIHIALLCIQKDPLRRPKMSSVLLMLSSQSMSLPVPGDIAWATTTNMANNNSHRVHGNGELVKKEDMTYPRSLSSITQLLPR